MAEPSDRQDEGSPRVDRFVLEAIRDRLLTASQFRSVAIVDHEPPTRLEAAFDQDRDPPHLERRFIDIRWYTNDDFRIHYQEEWRGRTWRMRWDRHPSAHNVRDHFHPPPDARTPGDDRSWPDDFRDVIALVLSSLADRDEDVWDDVDR